MARPKSRKYGGIDGIVGIPAPHLLTVTAGVTIAGAAITATFTAIDVERAERLLG
jgi:hypothetical protein